MVELSSDDELSSDELSMMGSEEDPMDSEEERTMDSEDWMLSSSVRPSTGTTPVETATKTTAAPVTTPVMLTPAVAALVADEAALAAAAPEEEDALAPWARSFASSRLIFADSFWGPPWLVLPVSGTSKCSEETFLTSLTW